MAEDENDDQEWIIRLKQDEEMDFFTELALHEAERWIQAVTRKKFKHPDDFRGSLANGVLLCELLNGIKPGTVKRINKLPGAIAGLDNINVFLNACEKNFGLNKTQLFDPGDLEDLSQRAIADESEYLLKQEVDRRARNVAITIYWLGRQVEGTFKGTTLDTSAFAALVHHHGNKNIISDECFKNENWQTTQTSKENFKDVKRSSHHGHARDSSYDSLGSYEKESESSFDELDPNMPVRDLRRYGSASSLGKENNRYSVANDSAFSDRHDSLYQSSPDLSQGSHAHTRSSSTDSMDGSYYGNNHSRQSSGSADNYSTTRLSSSSSGRRTSTSTADPLQFVKTKGADELAKTAVKQIEAAKETTLMRPVLRGDEGEPDWQSKLSGWKSRRKSASAAVYQRVGEVEGAFLEDEEEPKTKTFSQMMAEKDKRRSLGNLGNLRSIYPMEDDDSTGTKLKLSDPLHIMKSEEEITEATEHMTKKKVKGEEVAPWARDSSGEGDSQSDSETNNSHQSGDTDNVFSEQNIPKVIHQDKSWVKSQTLPSSFRQAPPPVKQTPPSVGNKSIKERNMQLWENSAKESQTKLDKKKVDIPTSNNKIRNITKAFEEKESSAKAEPVITRRSEFSRKSWSVDSTDSPYGRRSWDYSDKSSPKGINEKNVSPLLSPTSPKALLPKDQRTSGSNFKYSSDYGSNKPVEKVSRSKYIQKLSASPAAPFGYRGRSSSSEKESQTTNSREPSSEAADRPLRSTSTAGSESSGIISPTNSEVFYPSEQSPGIMSSSGFGTTSNKDENSEIISASSKVNASDSCVATPSSLVSSDVTCRIFSHDTSPKIKLENSDLGSSEVSFYLSPEEQTKELPNSSVDSDVEPVKNLAKSAVGAEPVSYQTEAAEAEASAKLFREADEEKEVHRLHSLQQNTDIAVQADKTMDQLNTSGTWEIENNHKMSPDDISNCSSSGNSGSNLNGERDPLMNINVEQEQRNALGEVVEEQIHAAKVLQSRIEPEIFLYSTIADGQNNTREGDAKAMIEGSENSNSRRCITPETIEPDYVDIAAVQTKTHTSGHTESSDIIPTIPSDYSSIIYNDKDQTVDSDLIADGLTQSNLLSVDASYGVLDLSEDKTSSTAVTTNPLTSLSSNVSTAPAGPQIVEDNKSNAPDLISSIPFLPLLTPYRSEESTTEKIDSPYEEDVFFDEDKLEDCGLVEEHQETVINRLEADEASEIHKCVEKTIKISQNPNNSRGFGFFIVGGSEKREPVTVHKVSLGSSADLCDVLADDELLSVNNHDVCTMTLKQVQAIIDGSVKRGQIELKIRRRPDEGGSFDSMEDEGGAYIDRAGNSNKMDAQSDSSSFSTDPLSDDASYKTPQMSSLRQTGSDDNEKPSLMDRLLAEKSREPNNNLDLSVYKTEKKAEKPPSPVPAENIKAEISFSSHMTPSRRSPVTITQSRTSPDTMATNRQSPVTTMPGRQSPVTATESRQSPLTTAPGRRSPLTTTPSRWSPVTAPKAEVKVDLKSETPSVQKTEIEHDIVGPDGDTVVEERQTIAVKPSPVLEDEPPVVMRRRKKQEKQKEEPVKPLEIPPPAPPSAEPPNLPKLSTHKPADADESGGFGPPAALLRWQRPRAKSEYINPYPSLFDKQVEESKRLSSTLPWRSSDLENVESKETSKDDSVLSRVTKDFESTVAVSKPPLTKSKTYHFEDESKLEDWAKKQEEKRQHEPQNERPVTPPPAFEVEIRKEERLTPQLQSSKPGRKVGVPNLMEIPVSIPGKDETPLSPQEKFERDQQRIRQQYEEEKRKAREAEKQREEQEVKLIKDDSSRLLHLESQIQPNKLEDMKPVHPPVQSQPMNFTSEPLTIKIPANSQGRQLVIDPRNQEEPGESAQSLPQYTFHVDLQKQDEKPQLRNLNQEPELNAEELLEKERQRIREEEHRKFEEEKRRWKEEQDEQLRKEQERLREEREAIEREKAKLEQKHVNSHTYQSPRSSSGSTGSSVSHSPRSPPPALDPHHRGASVPPRKMDIWAPPSTQHTASKSDISAKEKARLTREDLLAMNRKPTPLQAVQNRQEGRDSVEKETEHKTREAPSKLELHMLNSVPKPKFRRSADWIKDDEQENSVNTDKYTDKQFVIGHRSDIIHKDYSNSQDHWVVQEAERRRLAEQKDYGRRVDKSDNVHTAGPAKPSTSSLVNRFRGDAEPNKNRYSYPAPRDTDSRHSSSRPLSTGGSSLRKFERSNSPELSSTQQFSAKNQSLSFANPSLSNTLPANFSFNANKPRREPPAPAPKPQRSPTEQAEQMNTVSGKQKCSHCNEELGFGAAMVIESLGLYYHVQCFRCCVCRTPLGNGSEGADVRVRVNKLHCRNCFSNDEAGLKFSKV